MPTLEVAAFGGAVADSLERVMGGDLVGVWFVGSVALGGTSPVRATST